MDIAIAGARLCENPCAFESLKRDKVAAAFMSSAEGVPKLLPPRVLYTFKPLKEYVDFNAKRVDEIQRNRVAISSSDRGRGTRQFDVVTTTTAAIWPSLQLRDQVYPLPKLKTLPPYTTTILVAKNESWNASKEASYEPVFPTNFAPSELQLSILAEIKSETKRDAPRIDEEACEDIIYASVLKLGPTDGCVVSLSNLLNMTPSAVRSTCAEYAEAQALVYTNKNHPKGLRPTTNQAHVIEFFRALFCSACLVFDCKLHDSSRPPPKRNRIAANWEIDSAFTKKCKLAYVDHALLSTCKRIFHSDVPRATSLMKLFRLDGNLPKMHWYCDDSVNWVNADSAAARAMFAFERLLNGDDESDAASAAIAPPPPAVPPKKRDHTKKSTSSTRSLLSNASMHVPCDHDGPCNLAGRDCSCLTNKIACSKFCACDSSECEIIFKGCSYCSGANRAGGCTKDPRKDCECRKNHRECISGLCKCSPACLNQLLQRAQGKTRGIAVGLSLIDGWGVFAKRDFKKNDYIGEYVGEIIPSDVADKRGLVYDANNVSYLFKLCEDSDVDCIRRGACVKWINCSTERIAASIIPIVIQVDGDLRITLQAKRDIKRGEELTFNYSHEQTGAKPQWFAKNNDAFSGSSSEEG